MKKLMTIALLLLAGLTASAQGKWSTGMNKGDELKGTKDTPYYLYEVEGMGSFCLWDWKDWSFKITTDKGVFDVWNNDRGKYWVDITMGLYSLDGKLLDKFSREIEANHVNLKSAWMNTDWLYMRSPRGKIKKMFKAVKNGTGYIRIICKRRNSPDFDLKVMPYKI